ncbi:hypothetical protein [Nocardia testacea]|uniref:hypothetical protein n=1 Tax=Nocardia testacea TaxID=248551 RepID=UPI0033FBEBBD
MAGSSPEAEESSLYARALLRTNSQIVPTLAIVALPGPVDDAYRRWVVPARDVYRPSLKTVLDALVDCAG